MIFTNTEFVYTERCQWCSYLPRYFVISNSKAAVQLSTDNSCLLQLDRTSTGFQSPWCFVSSVPAQWTAPNRNMSVSGKTAWVHTIGYFHKRTTSQIPKPCFNIKNSPPQIYHHTLSHTFLVHGHDTYTIIYVSRSTITEFKVEFWLY